MCPSVTVPDSGRQRPQISAEDTRDSICSVRLRLREEADASLGDKLLKKFTGVSPSHAQAAAGHAV